MRRDQWTPEMARRLERLSQPHALVLGMVEDCLACRVDRWARRARVGAVVGMKVGRSVHYGTREGGVGVL